MTTRPATPSPIFDNIPDDLKRVPRWVCWRYEKKADGWAKMPIDANTGRWASSTDSSTWTAFEHAAQTFANRQHAVDGIGIVFSDDDDLLGIDLDDCLAPDTGELIGEAASIVASMPTYCEVSPSGLGVKLFARGNFMRPGVNRSITWDATHAGRIEIYGRARYFCVTGRRLGEHTHIVHLNGTLDRLIEDPARPSTTPRASIHAGATPYARAALEREAGAVCAAHEGVRNDTLNKAAFNLGTLIGAGELDRGEAEAALLNAARACGLGEHEAMRTIRSGLDSGERHPRDRTPAKPGTDRADIIVPEHPTFDLNALFPAGTEYARDYIADLSRSTQTPPEMAALLAMAIASATICNIARVRGHGDHIEPAPIWALVLSEPGTRKSAVVSALTSPITTWEADRARAMRKEIAEAVQRRDIDEKRRKKLSDRAAGEDDPSKRSRLLGELARLGEEMDAHPVPTPPVLLTSEPTPEALARMMAANGGRALLASAEADILDIVQGRYSGARNYGILLKGHAGDPYRAGRVGREADLIDSPALAVALCVQRAAVEALWADTQAEGRGLLARFAVVAPDDRLGYRDVRPAPIDPRRREAWHAALTRLLMFEMPIEPMLVELSPGADRLYLDLQHRVERELAPGGDLSDRRGWGGKLCGLVLRVALTLHALGRWAVPGGGVAVGEIDAPTMASAIAWGEYLQTAHRGATAGIVEDPADRDRRDLLASIRAKGGPVTARGVARTLSRYGGAGGTEAATADLDALVDAGHLIREPAPGGRTIQYRPTPDTDTSSPGGVENGESVGVGGVGDPKNNGGDA